MSIQAKQSDKQRITQHIKKDAKYPDFQGLAT